jgi:hypothetical protein
MGNNGGQWDTVDLVGLTNAYPQLDKDPASFAQMMPQLQACLLHAGAEHPALTGFANRLEALFCDNFL